MKSAILLFYCIVEFYDVNHNVSLSGRNFLST